MSGNRTTVVGGPQVHCPPPMPGTGATTNIDQGNVALMLFLVCVATTNIDQGNVDVVPFAISRYLYKLIAIISI